MMHKHPFLIVGLLALAGLPACFSPAPAADRFGGTEGTGDESGEDESDDTGEDPDVGVATEDDGAPPTDDGEDPDPIETGGDDETGGDETGVGETGVGETGNDDTGIEPAQPRRVFVTSDTFNGDEVASADQYCQLAANDAELGGNWIAWTSGVLGDAIDRLPDDDTAYARLDDTIVADHIDDLADGSLAAPIQITEHGAEVSGTLTVWTGTGVTGTGDVNDCLDWTVGTNAQNGMQGRANRMDGAWTRHLASPCHTVGRLYCFEL